jgi:hypothetical protein
MEAALSALPSSSGELRFFRRPPKHLRCWFLSFPFASLRPAGQTSRIKKHGCGRPKMLPDNSCSIPSAAKLKTGDDYRELGAHCRHARSTLLLYPPRVPSLPHISKFQIKDTPMGPAAPRRTELLAWLAPAPGFPIGHPPDRKLYHRRCPCRDER